MCSCRVLALVALASSVTGQVALHDQVTLPAEDGKIEFMDQDSSFGYAVTTTNKLLKIDLTSATNFAGESKTMIPTLFCLTTGFLRSS